MSGSAHRPGTLCQGSGSALPQPCEARKPAQAGRRLRRRDRDCRRGGERARRDHGGKRDEPPEARPPMAAEPPILSKRLRETDRQHGHFFSMSATHRGQILWLVAPGTAACLRFQPRRR
jgi:hypothetical protein